MPNLRIIADNAADRATLTASTTAGSLAATNLQNDRKGQPWRALSTTARLGATWTTSELIGGMFLPFCNLSPSATMRVRASNEAAEQNLLTFSDVFFANPWSKSGVLPMSSVIAGPSGALVGNRLVESGGAASIHELYRAVTLTAGQQYTMSVFLRQGERTKARFGFVQTGFSVGVTTVLDLATGAVLSVNYVGGSSGATVVLTPSLGGWYRASITFTPLVTGTWYWALDMLNATATASYAGDGVSSLYAAGAMLQVGSLSSYYPSVDTLTSRASVATYFGSNGLLQTAGSNVARMQYNPLNLSAPPFLLLEPAATNIFAYSEGTVAQTGGSNVTNAAVTIPGFAATLQFGDNSVARYSYRSAATTVSSVYTLSVFIAMDDGGVPVIGNQTVPGADFSLVFEGSVFITANITHVGNGVYRVSRALTATTTGNGSNGVVKYTTQSARGFRITGYQLELGAYPSSYIPTTTAAATRAADVATSVAATRPAGHIDTWQSYDYDSGVVPACPPAAVKLRGFTPAQAASAYAYGGGACARHWLPAQIQALALAVDISDPANLQGYIEAARLVVGEYWSPANNADYGASMTITDASKAYRTDGGDLLTDIGTRARKMPLSLSAMPPADRTALLGILRANGTAWPMLVSLFPGSADAELERDHTIYGKLSSVAAMALPNFDRYASTLEIEEV